MAGQAQHSGRGSAVSRAPSERPQDEGWSEIGAKLARVGAPLEAASIADEAPVELELPLEGGSGFAPSEIETRRLIAAFVRDLYDDVYDYAVELPLAPEDAAEATLDTAAPEEAAQAAPEPVEVQAFDRKTGKPITVKVRMAPQPAASAAKPAETTLASGEPA